MGPAVVLSILIKAVDHASKVLDDVVKSAGGFGSRLGGAGKVAAIGLGAATAAIGVLAAAAVPAVQSAAGLQQAVANISTIKPEIDTSGVFNALNDMSTRVPQSAQQLGDALYNVFSSVDVSQSEAIRLVEQFAKGATGAQTDAQTFGTAVMGVMNAYKLSVEDAGHISDVFFNTVKSGVVTGQELAANLGPVTQAAKAAGVSLDDLGGLLVGVTKEGGPAAQNINNLNNFLQKVTTKEAQTQIRALGVATTDAAGNFRPVIDVLTDLKPRLDGMTEAARASALQAIFPDAQARQGAQTLISQIDAVKAAIAENKAGTGAAEDAYKKMSATFSSQSALLGNSVKAIGTAIGAELLPPLTAVVSFIAARLPGAFAALKSAFTTGDFTPLLTALGQVGQQILSKVGEWGKALIMWVGSHIEPALRELGHFGERVVTWLRDEGLPQLVASLAEWGAAFIEWIGPRIGPALAALGGLLLELGGWLLGTALPEIASGLAKWGQELVEWIGPRIGPMLAELGGLLLKLGGWLLGTALPDLIAKLAEWGAAFLAWVGPRIPELIVALGGLLGEVIGWIAVAAIQLPPALVAWGLAFLGWIAKDVLPFLAEKLGQILTALGAWIRDSALPWIQNELPKLGRQIVEGIARGITAAAGAIGQALSDAADAALKAAKRRLGIESPSRVAAEEIGLPISQGIADGILSGQSAINRAVETVVQGAMASSYAEKFSDFLSQMFASGGQGVPTHRLAFDHLAEFAKALEATTATVRLSRDAFGSVVDALGAAGQQIVEDISVQQGPLWFRAGATAEQLAAFNQKFGGGAGLIGAFQRLSSSVSQQAGVTDVATAATYGLAGAASAAAAALAGIGGGGGGGGVSGGPGGGGPVPRFASGVENFRGGLAYVHQGELLVNLPPGTSVYRPEQAAPLTSGASGAIQVHITFQSPVYGLSDFDQQVKRAVHDGFASGAFEHLIP